MRQTQQPSASSSPSEPVQLSIDFPAKRASSKEQNQIVYLIHLQSCDKSYVVLKIMNATAIPECQTLDVRASATELGVCEETVRRLVRRKVLRKLPGLRRVLIPK